MQTHDQSYRWGIALVWDPLSQTQFLGTVQSQRALFGHQLYSMWLCNWFPMRFKWGRPPKPWADCSEATCLLPSSRGSFGFWWSWDLEGSCHHPRGFKELWVFLIPSKFNMTSLTRLTSTLCPNLHSYSSAMALMPVSQRVLLCQDQNLPYSQILSPYLVYWTDI